MEFITVLILILIFIFLIKIINKNNHTEITEIIEDSKSFTYNSLNKIKKGIDKNISKSYITGKSWLLIDSTEKILYTFRDNGELLLTIKGIVEKGYYELIVDNNSLLITMKNVTEQYDIVNIKDDIIYLYKISTDEHITLVNRTKVKDDFKKSVKNIVKANEYEFQKYTLPLDYLHDHYFLSCSITWEKNNPKKNVFDFIDEIEIKYKNEYDYKIWKKHNPDKSRINFGEFLVYKQRIMKNRKNSF